MPRIVKVLSALELNRLTRVGMHAVGGVPGLLLQVRLPTVAGSSPPRSWLLRIRIGEKRQSLGLGSFPLVPLAEARKKAQKLALEAKNGINLVSQKRTARSALIAAAAKDKTFQDCALAYMVAHASDYSNEKHRKQWASTIEAYAHPVIGRMIVADIEMRNVLDVLLQPTTHRDGTKGKLWEIKTETAKRLLDRIRTILDYAAVNQYRSGTNPATWKGFLDTQLASPRGLKVVRHHPSLPYAEAGDFMSHLRKNQCISARCLEFLVLTGVRSGSVREATWSEIDFNEKLWIIPAAHTKTKQEHRVPLPPQAMTILQSLPRLADTKKVFPSTRGGALSDMALSQLMRGMKERGEFKTEAVPHGFRATFRTWSADQTGYPDEIRKAASGHVVGDATKEAYQRTDLLKKRRRLMQRWAKFLDQSSKKKSANVTPIRRNRA